MNPGPVFLGVVALAVAAVVSAPLHDVMACWIRIGATVRPPDWGRTLRRRGRVDEVRALAEATASLAAAVRAGRSLAHALADVDDTTASVGLGTLRRDLDRGRPLSEAVRSWADTRGDAEARLLAGAILVGQSTGGRLAESLDGIAATLTIRSELTAEAASLVAQALATARLLVVAPAVFAVGACLIDDRVMRVTLLTPAGWLALGAAAGLDVLAWRWMRRIIADGESS